MCKTFLWPIFHYYALPDSIDKKSETEAWEAYYEANLTYAKKVAEEYQTGDLVRCFHFLLFSLVLIRSSLDRIRFGFMIIIFY